MKATPLDIEFISGHRIAHLATADAQGRPLVIPVCYVFDGEHIYSPIDEKPKGIAARRLKRLRNIAVNPQVSLVIDHYSEDWSQLRYVLISGLAEILEPGEEHAQAVALLRAKYQQYRAMAIDRRPMIKITPARIRQWRATSPCSQ